jgi:Flp pilus assembly pilin Flp
MVYNYVSFVGDNRDQMNKGLQKLLRKLRTRSGVSLTEYAFILVIVSIVAIAILEGIGGKTNNMVSSVNDGFVP